MNATMSTPRTQQASHTTPHTQRMVIALGGNALGSTPQEQLELISTTARSIVDLIEELEDDAEPASLGEVTVQGCTVNGAPCAEGCCDIWSLRKPH